MDSQSSERGSVRRAPLGHQPREIGPFPGSRAPRQRLRRLDCADCSDQTNWICYAGGVGEDVTFDLEMINRFGCEVFAFDPTPRAVAHVVRVAADEPRFHFMPVGIWSEDTTLRFYAPRDPSHVSHSALNLQRTDEYFIGPCRSVMSLMAELGHDRIDLVKIDIEGAEHRVIRSMLDSGVRPTVLCTEIDQPVAAADLWRTVRRVLGAGYALVAVDQWNLTFVREDAMPGGQRATT